ncbi:DNA polymerase III subunit [Marinoscillum luteum]|uniref:ATP-binding protein n=1 Tax=Marinoscillum luteum TaxID=861051 RepID=A0ABW7N8D5_9BACT
MRFADIPGLESLKESLVASYKNNHIAHAQLFNGPVGGGGLSMALAFATYLLCENKQEQDACGACPNCHKMERLIHPDVHYIYPKPSASKATEYDKLQSDTLKKWRTFAHEQPYGDIEDWVTYNGYENKNVLISKEDSRNIIKTVSMKSFEGDFKILIIWYPEYMHPAAANGILKVLEEPPTQTIYLLVSYAYDTLLATIKSRTQIFNVAPFQESVIAEHLISQRGADPQVAEKIARLASGSMGKAFYELEHAGSIAYESFRNWMQICLKGDYTAMVQNTESFLQSSKPQQRNQLEFAIALIRDAILSKADNNQLLQREGAEGEFIKKFGGFATLEVLENIYINISNSLNHLQRNASPRITYMNLSLQCSKLLRS